MKAFAGSQRASTGRAIPGSAQWPGGRQRVKRQGRIKGVKRQGRRQDRELIGLRDVLLLPYHRQSP